MRYQINWGRGFLACLLGGIAFPLAVTGAFLPAQTILANPAYQSAKMMKVFFELEPLPRTGTDPGFVLFGLFLFGILHALIFVTLFPAFPGTGWRKGIGLGFMIWLVAIFWFEFFILWNVLHEPLPLILVELALWLMVSVFEGIVIAIAYGRRLAEIRATS